MRKKWLVFLSVALVSGAAMADDLTITLDKDGYAPSSLNVPAGQVFELTVKNDTQAPMEFESSALKREKYVKPNDKASLKVGPLEKGTYLYFNDFHRETTGVIVAQ
jgi:hypothetical protein